jgi:hypothetical protein
MAVSKRARCLENAFERSSVFYVSITSPIDSPAMSARRLCKELRQAGISAFRCDFQRARHEPAAYFQRRFLAARNRDIKTVLLAWSLEHQHEPELRGLLGWMKMRRDAISQPVPVNRFSVPVVLIVHPSTYRDYVIPWAGDLVTIANPLPDD